MGNYLNADTDHARAVSIHQVSAGLLVRAQIVVTVDDRRWGRWQSLERTFSSTAIEAERQAARERRGTGHVAGPIERSLRLLERQADDRRLRGLTVIQHHVDEGWLVWHDGPGDGGPELFSMTAQELRTLDATSCSALLSRHRHRPPATVWTDRTRLGGDGMAASPNAVRAG